MLEHGIRLDVERAGRIGFDEAIFSESKSEEQLAAIVDDALHSGSRRLLTRLSRGQFAALPAEMRTRIDYDPVSRTAIVGAMSSLSGVATTAVICAGSSDLPASMEAVRTLTYLGFACDFVPDVGVAGLWRLLGQLDRIASKDVVIVAAGMDGALPSVVGGLVSGVVIALPTSVGYGAGSGGNAALGAALSSCAPGVAVVNIDNGYGAACIAARVLRRIQTARSGTATA